MTLLRSRQRRQRPVRRIHRGIRRLKLSLFRKKYKLGQGPLSATKGAARKRKYASKAQRRMARQGHAGTKVGDFTMVLRQAHAEKRLSKSERRAGV